MAEPHVSAAAPADRERHRRRGPWAQALTRWRHYLRNDCAGGHCIDCCYCHRCTADRSRIMGNAP